MIQTAPPIGVAGTERGLLLSLPPRFWLVVSLRRSIKRVLPGEAAWTYLAPASEAVRVEQWIAEVELQLAADRRRRAWTATDSEWDGLSRGEAPAEPAVPQPPIVVTLPTAATTKATLKLLERLAAGEILVRTPAPGAPSAPRIFVLRPSDVVVRSGVATRAIEQCLVVPSCDGLFGPDTSQTWTAPSAADVPISFTIAGHHGGRSQPCGNRAGEPHA